MQSNKELLKMIESIKTPPPGDEPPPLCEPALPAERVDQIVIDGFYEQCKSCADGSAKWIGLVKEYWRIRGLIWPSELEGVAWLVTEVGEAFEVLLARGAWVRNNPEGKFSFDPDALADELGDVIMMAIVTGVVAGVNPLKALAEKMWSKVSDIGVN